MPAEWCVFGYMDAHHVTPSFGYTTRTSLVRTVEIKMVGTTTRAILLRKSSISLCYPDWCACTSLQSGERRYRTQNNVLRDVTWGWDPIFSTGRSTAVFVVVLPTVSISWCWDTVPTLYRRTKEWKDQSYPASLGNCLLISVTLGLRDGRSVWGCHHMKTTFVLLCTVSSITTLVFGTRPGTWCWRSYYHHIYLQRRPTSSILCWSLNSTSFTMSASTRVNWKVGESQGRGWGEGWHISPSQTLGALLMVRSDQKGKEFDLGLRSCTSYDAPCSVCEVMARSGSGPFKTTSIGCFRRY